MGSPVRFSFASFIQIHRDLETPIYLQIANHIISAIQRGILLPEQKLPGTRTLSIDLETHRNTITAAYEELNQQGWISIQQNKGAFILPFSNKNINKEGETRQYDSSYPQKTGFSFQKSNLLDNPFEHIPCDFVFNDGTPDIRLTQIDDLSRFYSANMKRKSNRKKMGYYNQEGSEYFKKHLSNYLNVSRGFHISPQNLLITRSIEMSLYIISEVLLQANDLIIVGELSFFSANMIFQKSGARIQSIPIDEDGLCIDSLKDICEQETPRMVYVTPHHHYPTTVSLSSKRRLALLELAKEKGFIIVEDDYDYDFQYEVLNNLPLATTDTSGMVVYVSSFGKSLAPGFRTGFIVAPKNLMIEMQKHLGIIDRQGDILMEQALGEMIDDGIIHRHLKKSLKVYRERRDHCVKLLHLHLNDWVDFDIPSGGLAFWLRWKKAVNLMQLSQQCQKKQLFIPKTLLYQNKNITAIRIGFGHLTFDEMENCLLIIKNVLEELHHINRLLVHND
ncbi:PLP-dependent aminotransferase family protein [Pedobacter nyackensis]|uniref:aminotransferase-like domain-containing protein n=1 Tax=Pedobacter nyackensis TaxID=475255 RepID=UPI00292E50EB|nr:PLP-dependent aminotransferase family protein [Pedobacter nyackensis]